MIASTQWQLAKNAAEKYQSVLTPAILGPFAEGLVDCANLQEGETVLDIGCGTGAAARYAAMQVGETGSVIGMDVNRGMLNIARSLPLLDGAPIDWREGNGMQIPLGSRYADVVFAAQVLQFLPDKQKALHEMKRVVKENGRIFLSIWCDIHENPYFEALLSAITYHIGQETAVGLESAFSLSAVNQLETVLQEAGISKYERSTLHYYRPFQNLEAFIPKHINATPMAIGFQLSSSIARHAIVQEVVARMEPYLENHVHQIPFSAHIISF